MSGARHSSAARELSPDPTAASNDGLPPWFYGLSATALAVALALPYPPVKYALAAVFGWVYLGFLREAPHRTLFVFILVMPALDLIPPSVIPIPGINPETLTVLTLAAAAALSKKTDPNPPSRNLMLGPVLFYVGVMLVSALFSYLRGVQIWEGTWHTLSAWETFASVKNQVFYCFLGPISFVLLSNPERVRTAVRLIALTTALVGIHALADVRDVLSSGLLVETNRVAGLVAGQPNLLGGFLAIVLSILIPLFMGKSSPLLDRVLFGAGIVCGGAALLFTLSRGSWLALGAGLVVIALFRGARLVVFLLVVALTSQWWLPESVVQRVEFTTEDSARSSEDQELDDSAQVRLDQWMTLPTMLGQSPIIGNGFRSFESIWAQFGPQHRPKAAHSSIIELTTEQGLFGLSAYAGIVLTMMFGSLRLRRRRSEPFMKDLGVGFLAAVICLVMLDTSGTRFRNGEVMAYVWILAGAVTRMSITSDADPLDAGSGRSSSASTHVQRRFHRRRF